MMNEEWIDEFGNVWTCHGEPRDTRQIVEALNALSLHDWYLRFLTVKEAVQEGSVRLVDCDDDGHVADGEVSLRRWKRAVGIAADMEGQYGRDLLTPSDEFEWGKAEGRLAALRWVIGEDWS